MKTESRTITMLVCLVVVLICINLVSIGTVNLKTVHAASPPEFTFVVSGGLNLGEDRDLTSKRLTAFTNDLEDNARKGWRLKTVSASSTGGGWTFLYAILEK